MASYTDIDTSADGSAPGELFQFTGAVQAYCTSAPEAVTFSGLTYEPEHIFHSELEQSQELNKQQLEITVRNSNAVAQAYIAEIPYLSVNVRIFRFLEGLSDFRLVWAGQVSRATFSSDSDECVLMCDPIFTMLKRAGLRRNYQILCPYSLYDTRCGVGVLQWSTTDFITAIIGGSQIQSSQTAGSNTYTGGVLIHNGRNHLLINHANSRVYLISPLKNASAGDRITLIAGCDKLLKTCRDKFHNHDNFGGFPYIPTKNPFTGDSMVG